MHMSTSNSTTDSLAPADSASKLLRVASLAEQFGVERITREAKGVAERVTEGLFYVACVGQFKRGKSTLLNALVGDRILPAAVVPLTTVPTVVRFGGERRARVRLQSGAWENIPVEAIEQYVSEEENPQNVKGVTGVEVFVPSPMLANGMCLVDTPGLGSVFEANTAATREFVPHIDAGIVVIGADPPLSGDELELVEVVAHHVRDLLFVLNKADRASEADRGAAIDFSRRMLERRLGRPAGRIFEVSAVERLENRGPERDWPAFIRELEDLAHHSGHILTRAAADRGLCRLCDQLLGVIAEEREALLRPVEQSERRIAGIHDTIAAAERSLADLGYLLTGEQHRLSRQFEQRRMDFFKRVLPIARQELWAALKQLPRSTGPRFQRAAMRQAQEIAKRHVIPWLESEQVLAEEAYGRTAQRFIELANDFLRRLEAAGPSGLVALPETPELEEGFRTKSRFHFYDFIELAQPASPLRYASDLVLGLVRAYSVIETDAFEFLYLLLETNASRVQNDLDERLAESRRRLEAEIRNLLLEVSKVAERALAHAKSAQDAGAPAVQAALANLESVASELRSLRPPEPA
jgi:GTP-binding protein EngB required for normal cell division